MKRDPCDHVRGGLRLLSQRDGRPPPREGSELYSGLRLAPVSPTACGLGVVAGPVGDQLRVFHGVNS